MPLLDGYQLCAKLKEDRRTRSIPRILITNAACSPITLQAIEGGCCDDIITRPVNQQELLARVRSSARVKRLKDSLIHPENVMLALAVAIEAKDPYTEGHITRVAAYAEILGREIGLSPWEQSLLRKGGILHDVGKVAVRENVLLKPGPLTREEYEHVKVHPLVGERICQPLGQPRLVLDMVRFHHERCDGRGYPDGLAGEEIPLSARIMALVDAYDALTTDRPYRSLCSPEQALQVLRREAGRQFDPELTRVFVHTFVHTMEADRVAISTGPEDAAAWSFSYRPV